jgi:hypothetical protein
VSERRHPARAPRAAAAPATPPLDALLGVVAALERAGIACALGGSGLLHAHGLVDHVGDWDLTTDAPPHAVLRALAGRDLVLHGNCGRHADHKVVTAYGAVEVIARFAFRVRDAIVRIPTRIEGRADGVPLGSLGAWAVAYTLLERPARVETVFARLAAEGIDAGTRACLLAEPLPAALARRLRTLPPRAAAAP